MRPRPAMPSVFPFSSIPTKRCFSHRPAFIEASAAGMSLARASMRPDHVLRDRLHERLGAVDHLDAPRVGRSQVYVVEPRARPRDYLEAGRAGYHLGVHLRPAANDEGVVVRHLGEQVLLRYVRVVVDLESVGEAQGRPRPTCRRPGLCASPKSGSFSACGFFLLLRLLENPRGRGSGSRATPRGGAAPPSGRARRSRKRRSESADARHPANLQPVDLVRPGVVDHGDEGLAPVVALRAGVARWCRSPSRRRAPWPRPPPRSAPRSRAPARSRSARPPTTGRRKPFLPPRWCPPPPLPSGSSRRGARGPSRT